ncbi:MAG: ribbon-helix-helix domain-containing protein [Candidatus Altiarchaeales archaeon]|nr:ribbon-helix-helix domain-containing protein [Candidatus Altiarchaeales archaeon]
MLSKEIRKLLKENEKYNNMFERYDQTRKLDLDKVRRSFTIRESSYRRLKELSESTGKSMSSLLDRMIEKE